METSTDSTWHAQIKTLIAKKGERKLCYPCVNETHGPYVKWSFM